MLRAAVFSSFRCASRVALVSRMPIARTVPNASVVTRSRLLVPFMSSRFYSAPAGLTTTEVQERIMDLLKNFDKVEDSSKITSNSHFSKDLGLDSLDTVEVVMAIEEEFSIEIPDKEADAIHSIDQAVEYILRQPDAH